MVSLPLDTTSMWFFLSFIFLPSHILCELQCWFPDGQFPNGTGDYIINNYSENDRPCYPDRDVSFCCGIGESCATNNLCIGGPGTAYMPFNRGTCTDRTWQSPECPQFCRMSSVLQPCGPDVFCCADNSSTTVCDCSRTDRLLKLRDTVTFGTINPRASARTISGQRHTHIPDGVWGAVGAVASVLSLVVALIVWRWQVKKSKTQAKRKEEHRLVGTTHSGTSLTNTAQDLERYRHCLTRIYQSFINMK